jgi:hypothetical protein
MFIAMASIGLITLNNAAVHEKDAISQLNDAMELEANIGSMNSDFLTQVKLAKDLWIRGGNAENYTRYRIEFLEKNDDFVAHANDALDIIKRLESG